MKNTLFNRFFPNVQPGDIVYKEGDKITGKEKVMYTDVVAGVHCHFISDFIFKVSTEGLVLLQDNTEAVNIFGSNGYRHEKVLNEWTKAETLPEWIYFCKKNNDTSCSDLEKHYEEVINPIELNVISAFNTKYRDFHRKFPNGVQIKNSDGKFYCGHFSDWPQECNVFVYCNPDGSNWSDAWWFACVCK